MTIRHHTTLLVVLMFVALTTIDGYAVYQTHSSAAEVRQVTEGVIPSTLASADLVSFVKNVQLAMMVLVYTPDANIVTQTKDDLKVEEAVLHATLGVQTRHANSRAQEGLVAQAKKAVGSYVNVVQQTTDMKLVGKDELAQTFLLANMASYHDVLEKTVGALHIEKNREKDEVTAGLNGKLASTATIIGVVSGVAVVLLTATGVLLYRQITRLLTRVQTEMSEITTNQDFTRRVPVGRMDEVDHSIAALNQMIEKTQRNATLLEQKTADIQAMLQNMQQGILTVIEGNVMHEGYSVYLESIFGTQEIAGRRLMELIFADTNLGADTLSQVEATVDACLGQDITNLAFNQHLLASEVEKRTPDGRTKTLNLSWSTTTDESDTIPRLMLCACDVTEPRKLAVGANKQCHNLEMIGKILAVSQEKLQHFIDSSTTFMHENERIIRQYSQAGSQAIAALFRNMHTIKDSMHTYNLQHLTNVVHKTGQACHALREADSGHTWDQDWLIQELARVHEAIENYARINEVKLNRKSDVTPNGTPQAAPDVMVRIQENLRLLESANPGSLYGLVVMRDSVYQLLRLLDGETVDVLLSDTLQSLPSLTQKLGRKPMAVRIDGSNYRVRTGAHGILQSIFMHLLRNSIDHGTEPTEERIAQDRPASGTIDTELGVDQGVLQITLCNGGHDLALERIRSITMERGWLDIDQHATDEDIAQCIFRPGFSTADKMTEVSGRSVGMDTVQGFLKHERDRIKLRFIDDHKGAAFHQFQTVVCLPRHFAVDSVNATFDAALAVRVDLDKGTS